eukprot:8795869-Pyramimonas_sp.AAC.1
MSSRLHEFTPSNISALTMNQSSFEGGLNDVAADLAEPVGRALVEPVGLEVSVASQRPRLA